MKVLIKGEWQRGFSSAQWTSTWTCARAESERERETAYIQEGVGILKWLWHRLNTTKKKVKNDKGILVLPRGADCRMVICVQQRYLVAQTDSASYFLISTTPNTHFYWLDMFLQSVIFFFKNRLLKIVIIKYYIHCAILVAHFFVWRHLTFNLLCGFNSKYHVRLSPYLSLSGCLRKYGAIPSIHFHKEAWD